MPDPTSDASPFADGSAGGFGFRERTLSAVAVAPAMATITSLNNAVQTQQFQLVATYTDATTATLTNGVHWSATNYPVGTVDGAGVYTANGSHGGLVTLTGAFQGKTATASLKVGLHLTEDTGNASASQQNVLRGASSPDPAVRWAYPYDGTVFPRGLPSPELQWTGGVGGDMYYVHVRSDTFDLEDFATAAQGRYTFAPGVWDTFTSSTSGSAELTVARLPSMTSGVDSGVSTGTATVIVAQKYTIAPASMRGTIYYWAINTGRVMRIKPGAQADDMFGSSPIDCPSCHTASADGSRLLMNTGIWPNETSVSYDLKASQNAWSGYPSTTGPSAWALGAISADGAVVVQNWAALRGTFATAMGAFDTNSGQALVNTGLEASKLWMPAFSPDNKLLTYVTSNNDSFGGDLHAYDWDAAAKHASNDRLVVAAGSDANTNVITMPSVSPDHASIVYQRSTGPGSLGNAGDLYSASVNQPGPDVALDNLNGTMYPFAAGDRDRHLNYEPTFAPVAAGGYFWVVFHSRRTYGSELTGPAYVQEGQGVKQLWVAAIDQSPTPGKDPSHPAFWLPGQDLTTLNMRGFWSLDPCQGDGRACRSGTECCGGYCAAADAGGPVCASQSVGCANAGDHCVAAAGCCGSADGVLCINGVCSEPSPR